MPMIYTKHGEYLKFVHLQCHLFQLQEINIKFRVSAFSDTQKRHFIVEIKLGSFRENERTFPIHISVFLAIF